MSRKAEKTGRPAELVGKTRTRFLAVLASTGLIGPAAKAAGVSRETVRNTRHRDKAFDQDCLDALDEYGDLVEAELQRRAIKGVVKPVFWQGRRVDKGRVREYSDSLLIAAAKRRRPEYRDGPQVTTNVNVAVFSLPERLKEHLEKRRNILRDAGLLIEGPSIAKRTNGNGSGNGNGGDHGAGAG